MFNNLSGKQIHLLAGVCAFLVMIGTLANSDFLPSSIVTTIVKILFAIATAIAVYVTMLGILPLRSEFEKMERRFQNFIIPPLIDSAQEDATLIEEIKDYFGKIETGFAQWKENLETILKVCEMGNNSQFHEDMRNCLEKINMIDVASNCPDNDTEQCYRILQKKLNNFKIIVVLYYDSPESWLSSHMRLYKKFELLNKIILCTNKKDNLEALLKKENIKVDTVYSKKLDCRKLAAHIDSRTKRYTISS